MNTEEKISHLVKKFNVAASYSSHQPDARPSPGVTDLVDRATKGGNHVFFGEPHVDGMVVKQYELMANNPEMFQKASANGVKHLALEFPNALQSSVDDYTSGKTTRAQFSERLNDFETNRAAGGAKGAFKENFIRTIDHAKAAGMKVHFADVKVDDDIANFYPPSVMGLEKRLGKQFDQEKPDMTRDAYIMQKSAELPEEERAKLRRDMDEHTEKWRMGRFDDTAQYLYLRERIPLHEGIMGVVGMDHLNNGMDQKAGRKIMGIDDHLEAEGKKVTTIEVHTGKTKDFMREVATDMQRLPQDQPDYVINLDKRTIESQSDGAIARMDGANEIRLAERHTIKPGAVALSY